MNSLTMLALFFGAMLVASVASFPANDDLLMEMVEDTAVVESLVREVRAAKPDVKPTAEPAAEPVAEAASKPITGKKAYIHTYSDGADGENEQGYYKRKSDKGDDGYKHFDSFHKRDADKYAFEAHSAYGKYAGQEYDAGEKKKKEKRAVANDGLTGAESKKQKRLAVAEEDSDEGEESEGGEYYGTYSVSEGNDDEGEGESESYFSADEEEDEEEE